MPTGAVLVAAAVAAMLYAGGSAVVHGVKKAGHTVKAGIVRIVHPHHRSDDGEK